LADTTTVDGLIQDKGSRWSACTLAGPGRDHNSDALAIDLSGACLSFVIADGVGAMPGSPIASDAAATAASDWITNRSDIAASEVSSLMGHVGRSVKARLDDKDLAGATTIVALAIGAGQGLLATVGDSEAIAVHERGPAVRLNPVDHLKDRPNVLTAWIDGKEPFTPHIIRLQTLPYRLCLMTDGVSGVLGDIEIAEIVRSVPANEAAQRLVTEARAAGSRDDASCIVISSDIEQDASTGLLSKIERLLPFGRKGN
jgi:serine/threonine protein phosphatase PrpC